MPLRSTVKVDSCKCAFELGIAASAASGGETGGAGKVPGFALAGICAKTGSRELDFLWRKVDNWQHEAEV